MEQFLNKIFLGDNMKAMAEIPSESVDLIVTDPPYGLTTPGAKNATGGFMGKKWDKAVPPVEVWQECLRILKPGAFAFVMSIPRQDCLARMIVNLEDAGFNVSFTSLYHVFAQGFPKAANLSKLADKRAGAEREVVGRRQFPDGSYGRETAGDFDGTDSKTIDRTHITAPATPEAKALEGSYAGYQPKPCLEIIICAMRPLSEKTYLDQALANKHGCTHLDAGRIPYESDNDLQQQENNFKGHKSPNSHSPLSTFTKIESHDVNLVNVTGRFAPNLLCSDDVLNDGRLRPVGTGGEALPRKNGVSYNVGNVRSTVGYGDSGSFSRYFSLDAWAKKYLPENIDKTFPFLCIPKPSPGQKNAGLDDLPDKQMYKCDNSGESLEIFGTTDGGRKPRKNIHPTCKSISLMGYLLSIGSREGDFVYDPYAGSCTTACASVILKRNYGGAELDPEYHDIGVRRIEYWKNNPHELAKPKKKAKQDNPNQTTLF